MFWQNVCVEAESHLQDETDRSPAARLGLREPVESAERLGDEVEECSADVSPVLPVGGEVRSTQRCGVEFVPDPPQLGGHSPDLHLLPPLRRR